MRLKFKNLVLESLMFDEDEGSSGYSIGTCTTYVPIYEVQVGIDMDYFLS